MIKPINRKFLEESAFAGPVFALPSLHSIVLKIKALSFESASKVSNTIIENTRAFIEAHNEGYREADRLRQAARRIFTS